MKRIALLGECMIELNGSPFGSMEQTYGGDSLNSAIYLKRSAGDNLQVSYVTALGIDPLSEGMRSRWQDAGIDIALVLRDEKRQPGLYLIQLDDLGERTFLYWRDQSAARYLLQHPGFEKVEATLMGYDMVYLSGISLAILPREDRSKLIELLSKLRDQGTVIAFDSNYRPALWESADSAREWYQKIYQLTSLALVTNDDESDLWGDVTIEDTQARLARYGVEEIIIKAGSTGCYYQHTGQFSQPQHIPADLVEHVVDTTSAGDSFNAGFLAGYLQGKSPVTCCQMGHRLAGMVIQHRGAIVPESATRPVTDTF